MLVAMLGFMTSCGDDDKTNTELLTQHNWKAKKVTSSVGTESTDGVDEIRFTFNTNGAFTFTAITADQSVAGTWDFNSGETAVNVTPSSGDAFSIEINSLTDDELNLTYDSNIYDLEPVN